MFRLIKKRLSLMLVALALVMATFVVLSPRTAAQGGFGYMCDAWEQSCDDGSGILPGGVGTAGGGGSTGGYYCKTNDWCGNWGCHEKSSIDHTIVCDLYKIGNDPGTCPSQINCTKTGF